MALDWEPLATPKRGYEREFVELFHALVKATGARRDRVMRWFTNISDPPFATLGAPRIGHDPAADDWLRARLEKTGRIAELPRLVIEMRGDHMMLPDDHKAFAEQLFDVAIRFADEHTLPSEVETIREPVFPEGSVERSGHILFAAAKWCWYWSERGYGLAVSY